jgi:phosphoserine aminotransferase
MGVMEMSHRSREFGEILDTALADVRALLEVPDEFEILFMQGGGLAENAIVPLNLSRGGRVDFVITGSWSTRSYKEAQRYCTANVAASNEGSRHAGIPAASSWRLSEGAAYVHVCSNETIDGIEFHELPDLPTLGCDAPLVLDFSSHMASRRVDWSRVGLAYGGAQKNAGPAGVTLVFVRRSLLGRALPICPSAFDYRTVADNRSMYNTPPTYAIYIAGLVFQWLRRFSFEGLRGIDAVERRNAVKAQLLYDCIDASGFYVNRIPVAHRSRMNVPFSLPDDRLDDEFLATAGERGLLHLKGHKSVGGMRASIYNAMPLEGVQALVGHMREFAARHG